MDWLPIGIWLYLLFARRWFWSIVPFHPSAAPAARAEKIAVIIPARDEAESIERVVR